MIHKILSALDKKTEFDRAEAHCDVPCGIYDPIVAQIAALTVVRMMDIMIGLDSDGKSDKLAYHNTMSRAILVKEEHAEKTKHEIRVIWGDYIKAPHVEKYPELPELAHNIMLLGSKSRQTVDRDAAVALVDAVNRFAEIFWETKGVATKKANAPYKPSLEMVYPVL